VLIERSNLERLMASAGLGAIIATDSATVAALAGYRSWLDGQFRQFMVSPWGSGDLIRTYAIFTAGDRPVAAIVDALFARGAASARAECWMYGGPARAALVDASAGFSRTPEEAIAQALTRDERLARSALEAALSAAMNSSRLTRPPGQSTKRWARASAHFPTRSRTRRGGGDP
jgi:hypothetical protein